MNSSDKMSTDAVTAEYQKLQAMGWALEYLVREPVQRNRADLVARDDHIYNRENPNAPVSVRVPLAVRRMFEPDVERVRYERKVESEARRRIVEIENRKRQEEERRRQEEERQQFENAVLLRMKQIYEENA